MSYSKLLKLEELKHHLLTFHTPKNEYKDIPTKIPNIKRVKRFLMKISPKTGWYFLGPVKSFFYNEKGLQ